jgi:NSS family neurotransmitter:Na+ symporter
MEKKETFSSRWGLILASLGMAIGCGNIWRFPRIAASNGGAAFLIPWIIFLILWSIPLLIIEYSLGRGTRMGVIGSFGKIMGHKYSFMGGFVAFCSMAIMFYYSVVTGWCIKYFLRGALGGTPLGTASEYWKSFSGSYQPVLFHLVAVFLGSFIVYRGIEAGIEKANKFLIPSLFALLIIAAFRAVTLPGAAQGLNFLFNPQWEQLRDYRVWLQGLTQSAWSTGAGWGLILTYAVYMKKREDTVLNSFVVGFGNNSASLLAGLAIIPTIFALLPPAEATAAMGKDNIGLTFISIPTLFSKMPGGSFFMPLFFLSLTFAALSSLISMLELTCCIFMDAGLTRKKAVFFVGIITFLLGLPSAFRLAFFKNQDWVWGLGLMVSGFFFVMAVTRYGVTRFRKEWVNVEGCDLKVGRWFDILVKYFIPVEFIAMLSWWFYQAVRWNPKGWWDIRKPESLGTCLFQWALVIIVFLIANNWIAKKMFKEKVAK